jgi:hypothetical protein
MPVHDITINGKTYEVTAPAGATPEQIREYAEKSILGDSQQQDLSMMQQASGAWEGAKNGLTLGSSDELQAAIAAGTVGLNNAIGGDSGLSMGQAYNQALDLNRQDQAQAQRNTPGAYLAGNVAGAILPTLATGGMGAGKAITNWASAGNIGARIGKGSALGALSGGIYGFNEGEGGAGNRLKNAAPYALGGAALGGAIPAAFESAVAGKNAVKALSGLTPTIDENLRPLGKLAIENNIPVSLTQLSDSSALKKHTKSKPRTPIFR